MPQERDSQFFMPTAAEIEAGTADRETKAARNIMVRNIPGIPRKAYLMGDSDHAPILKGVKDLTTLCYALLDAIPADQLNGTLGEKATELREMLEHHGCE